MKRLLLGVGGLVVVFGLAQFGGVASAHIYRENRGVTAELHMPPNDLPKAGQPTRLEFSFEDRNNRFDITTCDCSVAVTAESKELSRASMEPGKILAGEGGIASVNFPDIGEYKLVVEGKSRDNSFNTFKLVYPASVNSAVSIKKTTGLQFADMLLIGISGLAVMGLLVFEQLHRSSRARNS